MRFFNFEIKKINPEVDKFPEPDERPISCQKKVHLRCLEGTGFMDDGIICLDCGVERYPEVFTHQHTIIGQIDDSNLHLVEKAREKYKKLVRTVKAVSLD